MISLKCNAEFFFVCDGLIIKYINNILIFILYNVHP